MWLCLILFLHQTTTAIALYLNVTPLCLILFLHQTTTKHLSGVQSVGCVLFYFYIKPQLPQGFVCPTTVVSYSISTSNHNEVEHSSNSSLVVSYSISTSNHNLTLTFVIFYPLCLILFLHQTTTPGVLPNDFQEVTPILR